MTVNRIQGTLFTALSALNGRTLSSLTAVNGQTIDQIVTPSGIANIWDWWEPSRESYANNDPMPSITGQFASNQFTQATSARRPTYVTNQINSLGAAVHDPASAGQWWDTGPDMSALTAGHVWIVTKLEFDPPGSDTTSGLWSMSNNLGETFPATHYPFIDNTIYDACGSTTRKTVGDPSPAMTNWNVYEVVTTSSEWTAKMNGTQMFTTGTNTVGFLGTSPRPRLGCNSDATYKYQGRWAGFYIFSAKMSAGERTQMVDYLNDRFALSIS